jgi:MFS superfamily sulfate permease-like transporter
MENKRSASSRFEVKKYILKKNLKRDFPSSMVVFLVALPLCLGIALASGAPLFSGLIAGIIGGIVVGAFSGSQLSVSGPAAGLTAIVLGAIRNFGKLSNIFIGFSFGRCFSIVARFH